MKTICQGGEIASYDAKPMVGQRRFVGCPGFRLPGANSRYLLSLPVGWEQMKEARSFSESLELELQITQEERCRYFLMMNYLKFRASKAKTERQAEGFDSRAAEVRDFLILASQRLVGFAVKGTKLRPSDAMIDLISEGQAVLIRCIDKFDASKPGSFANYVCRSIRFKCMQVLSESRAAIGKQFGLWEDLNVTNADDGPHDRVFDVSRAFEDAKLTDKMIWTLEAYYGFTGPDMTKTEIARTRGVGTNSVTKTLDAAMKRLRGVLRKNRQAYVLTAGCMTPSAKRSRRTEGA